MLSSATLFAQEKKALKALSDSIIQTFPNTIVSDIEISPKVVRPLIAVDSISKSMIFICVGNAPNGAKSRVKTVVLNEKWELVFQKETLTSTHKGILDASEIIDNGDDWAIFNADDFYIEEFLISKKDGILIKAKQYDPKLLTNNRFFKYRSKLYLFTFDSKNYVLYQLEHGSVTLIGKNKFPEIPKFSLEKQIKEAKYIRDYRLTKFSEAASNSKIFIINNQLIFVFDDVPKTKNQLILLSIDLKDGAISKSSRDYPSVLKVKKVDKTQFSSFISSDGKLFMGAIGEKDFVLSIQNLENSTELKHLTCTKNEGFPFKNSTIYNDQSNFNVWTGKQQRKALDTLGETEFWDLILKSGLTILAIPTDGGYDLTCGNYIYTNHDDSNVVAASMLFGAVGGAIASASTSNISGTNSQYFYSRLNNLFEPVKNIEMPTNLTQQFKIFDYNPRFKYRTYFKMNGKDAFVIYHPESKKLMFVRE
jgi:hypothetical protein